MVTKLSRLGLGVIAVLTFAHPFAGHAYLTPEQVFGDSGHAVDRTDASAQPAPPLQREGESVIEQQQQRAAELRQAAQSSLQRVDAEPVDTYVPEKTNTSKNLFDQNAQYEKRQERKASSDANGPTIIIGSDGSTTVQANGTVLHSGAPKMSGTGPESVLAFAAMILAAISTILYARLRERRLAAG